MDFRSHLEKQQTKEKKQTEEVSNQWSDFSENFMPFSVLRCEEALELWPFISSKTNIPLPPPCASPSSKDPFHPWRLRTILAGWGINASLTHAGLSKSQKLLLHFVSEREKALISFSHPLLEYSHNYLLKIICMIFVSQKCPKQLLTQPLFPSSAIQTIRILGGNAPEHRHYPNSTAWNKKCRERRVKNWNSLSPIHSRERELGGTEGQN